MIFLYLILIILLLSFAISLYVVNQTLYPKVWDYQATYDYEVEKGRFTNNFYESLVKEEIYLESDEGYQLHCLWFPVQDSKKTIVLVHGYKFSLFGSMKYLPIFRDLGFNVMAYDHRYHGLSGGRNCTFGAHEKEDLKKVIAFAKKKTGMESIIGTHGESLGGVTVLLEAAKDSEVDFVIADCAFARMDIEIAYRLRMDYRLPSFPVVYMASIINRYLTGYYYDQVSPMASATSIKKPTMLIHGTDDDYTPTVQGDMIYESLSCPKKFYKAQGAGHAESIIKDPNRYREELMDFLQKHHLIE